MWLTFSSSKYQFEIQPSLRLKKKKLHPLTNVTHVPSIVLFDKMFEFETTCSSRWTEAPSVRPGLEMTGRGDLKWEVYLQISVGLVEIDGPHTGKVQEKLKQGWKISTHSRTNKCYSIIFDTNCLVQQRWKHNFGPQELSGSKKRSSRNYTITQKFGSKAAFIVFFSTGDAS